MDASRFDAAERSPRFAELMRHVPDESFLGSHILVGFLAMFGLSALGMTVSFLPWWEGALTPGGMTLFSVFCIVLLRRRVNRIRAAPLERVLVLVQDEQHQVSQQTVIEHDHHDRNLHPGHHHDRTRTETVHRYYLTLEDRDGERYSHPVDAETARVVSPGDFGVAYLKLGELLDFKRIPRV